MALAATRKDLPVCARYGPRHPGGPPPCKVLHQAPTHPLEVEDCRRSGGSIQKCTQADPSLAHASLPTLERVMPSS